VDASYDTSRVNPGDWVNSQATNDNDNEFNLTANETRLGFNFTGPKTATMETSGKVEFDFYGSGADLCLRRVVRFHTWTMG